MTAPLSCGYVNSVTIKLGLQIPNFSYGTGVAEMFPTVIAQAQEAEAAGFDSVFVMDHFYQLPMLGSPDQPMLEAYTALGGLATATERVQLGTMVTGNTYRNPTLLAKAITTLDVVSRGRAVLGIGTGWFELEHDQLGFEFGTFTDRFNNLDESLQIILPMLKGERSGSLTQRELEVLQMIVEGKSNKEIAAVLDLSANTVAVHRANIMNSLGIHKTAELVVYAIRAGLVNVP